jgi:glycogen(starch) synthase
VAGHSCVVSWWNAVHGTDPPAAWTRYRESVLRGLHAADLVVCPSEAMMRMLIEHYGPLPRAAVVANGRYADAAPCEVKDEFVLTAGRTWDAAKNIESVCAIAARVSWPVYVAGEWHGAEGVISLGRLTPATLAGWMARASIFVLPARYEPFGLCALEAGMAGCALVLGDIASLREVWGDAATYVNPDDREALAASVQELIDNDSLRDEMSCRAQARALQLTPTRMAAAYHDLYRALI